jgi:hypothetical protein
MNQHYTVHGELEPAEWSETPWDSRLDYHQEAVASKRRHLIERAGCIKRWIDLFTDGKTHTRGFSLEDFGKQLERTIENFNRDRLQAVEFVAAHNVQIAALQGEEI